MRRKWRGLGLASRQSLMLLAIPWTAIRKSRWVVIGWAMPWPWRPTWVIPGAIAALHTPQFFWVAPRLPALLMMCRTLQIQPALLQRIRTSRRQRRSMRSFHLRGNWRHCNSTASISCQANCSMHYPQECAMPNARPTIQLGSFRWRIRPAIRWVPGNLRKRPNPLM